MDKENESETSITSDSSKRVSVKKKAVNTKKVTEKRPTKSNTVQKSKPSSSKNSTESTTSNDGEIKRKKSKANDEEASTSEDISKPKEKSKSNFNGKAEAGKSPIKGSNKSSVINPWDPDYKVPNSIKSLRNFLDEPKTNSQKKRDISRKAPTEYDKQPWSVVYKSSELSNLNYLQNDKKTSLHRVSERRKSLTDDKERAISAQRKVPKLRLKDYVEESRAKKINPKNNRPIQSPPLVIPLGYSQLFIREYGTVYKSLQEASHDIRKRSAILKKRSASDKHQYSEEESNNESVPSTSKGSRVSSKIKQIKKKSDKGNKEEEDSDDEEINPVEVKKGTNKVESVDGTKKKPSVDESTAEKETNVESRKKETNIEPRKKETNVDSRTNETRTKHLAPKQSSSKGKSTASKIGSGKMSPGKAAMLRRGNLTKTTGGSRESVGDINEKEADDDVESGLD